MLHEGPTKCVHGICEVFASIHMLQSPTIKHNVDFRLQFQEAELRGRNQKVERTKPLCKAQKLKKNSLVWMAQGTFFSLVISSLQGVCGHTVSTSCL